MSSKYIAVFRYQNRLNNKNPVKIWDNLVISRAKVWSRCVKQDRNVTAYITLAVVCSTGVTAKTSPNDTSVAVTSSISIRVFARIFAHRIMVTVTIIWVLIFGLVVYLWWSNILLPVMCPIEILRWHIFGWLHIFADNNTIYKTSYQCQEAEDEKHYAEDPATTN